MLYAVYLHIQCLGTRGIKTMWGCCQRYAFSLVPFLAVILQQTHCVFIADCHDVVKQLQNVSAYMQARHESELTHLQAEGIVLTDNLSIHYQFSLSLALLDAQKEWGFSNWNSSGLVGLMEFS